MCKECGVKHYESFDELPQELKNKFKCKSIGRYLDRAKKAYVNFINELNKRGDELIGDYVNTSTKTLIKFGGCGHIPPKGISPKNYKNSENCVVCSGKQAQQGVNDLATTHPHLANQWHPTKNGSLLPTMVSYASNKEVWWLCSECGYEWEVRIANHICQNQGCPKCGDGMSYPEKLMALVLKALGIDFTKQLTYDNGQHKYDFYVALWKAIFETNGIQHYEDINWSKCGGRTLEDEQATDEYKRDDAINNHGILEENYHAVDCRKSTLEWCRPNIEKALSKYIDVSVLTDEDWIELDIQAQKSLKIDVCKRWKEIKDNGEDLTTTDLAKEFGIGKSTICGYLRWGNERGLCEYNGKQEQQDSFKRASKFVYLIKPNGEKWFEEPMSQHELTRHTEISEQTIGRRVVDSKPLKQRYNSKYDKKYIGSYVVLADEYDAQNN